MFAGLIGACVAYPAYELSSTFASFAFHRVASRIAMLILVVVLAILCRHLNLRQTRDFGYGLPWRRFLAVAVLWSAIGFVTAGVGAAFLLETRLRVAAADFIPSAASFARILVIGLASGLSLIHI